MARESKGSFHDVNSYPGARIYYNYFKHRIYFRTIKAVPGVLPGIPHPGQFSRQTHTRKSPRMPSPPILSRLILLSLIRGGWVLGSWLSCGLLAHRASNRGAALGSLPGCRRTLGQGLRPLHTVSGVTKSRGCRP